MLRRFPIIATALILSGAPLFADTVTLSTYLQDQSWADRLHALFGKSSEPDWLKSSTQSEAVSVTLEGKPYQVLLACKKHDCANHQLAVLFDAETMYGLQFETSDNSPTETLHWLNIGGGPESIDGKTILYAAITGSLFNHPKAFDYPAAQ